MSAAGFSMNSLAPKINGLKKQMTVITSETVKDDNCGTFLKVARGDSSSGWADALGVK